MKTLQAFGMVLLCLAARLPTAQSENIAAGKPYCLEPAPNYAHCTDPADATQLTDGIHAQGHFWTQKETVGWQRIPYAVITLDLGEIQPICGASLTTAAGHAGVAWPTAVFILVSDDGQTFHLAGNLVALSARHEIPPATGYAVHRLHSGALVTHGRFVKVLIVPGSTYSFTDELEIHRGENAFLHEPFTGRQISDVSVFFSEMELTRQVRRRLEQDLAAVRKAIESSTCAQALSQELTAIAAEIPTAQVTDTRDFRTVFPLHDLHRRIFAVQAAAWRVAFGSPVIIWQTPRWDMLSPTQLPEPAGATVDVRMMRNEFRSAAFNISLTSQQPTTVSLSIHGLPGGLKPAFITVHDGVFTDTKDGTPVLTALPLAHRDGGAYHIDIQPGLTHQVWLTFHSRDVEPGNYAGRIVVEPGGLEVPLMLQVDPLDFPSQPTLHLCGWDYTDTDSAYGLTPENRSALIRHLREHFVDSPWAQSSVLPRGDYDKEGHLIREPDTRSLDAWLERWPQARLYLVFAAAGDTFGGQAMGTPAFERAVSEWINFWVGALQEREVEANQLGLLLVDEPSTLEKSERIIAYAQSIKKAQPEVIIWNDPTWYEPWDAPPELFSLSTVLCPNLQMWVTQGKRFAAFYHGQREAGRDLWFYSCNGPSTMLDPFSYYRAQQWFCWKHGAAGSGFWAFADTSGASSWNAYLSRVGSFAPLFIDDKTVTPGKAMAAIREGVEDYEYLRMLRDRIAELEQRGTPDQALAGEKDLLASAADRVIADITSVEMMSGQTPKDRSVADQVRLEVLAALMKLQKL